jgi:hypothetical protein
VRADFLQSAVRASQKARKVKRVPEPPPERPLKPVIAAQILTAVPGRAVHLAESFTNTLGEVP